MSKYAIYFVIITSLSLHSENALQLRGFENGKFLGEEMGPISQLFYSNLVYKVKAAQHQDIQDTKEANSEKTHINEYGNNFEVLNDNRNNDESKNSKHTQRHERDLKKLSVEEFQKEVNRNSFIDDQKNLKDVILLHDDVHLGRPVETQAKPLVAQGAPNFVKKDEIESLEKTKLHEPVAPHFVARCAAEQFVEAKLETQEVKHVARRGEAKSLTKKPQSAQQIVDGEFEVLSKSKLKKIERFIDEQNIQSVDRITEKSCKSDDKGEYSDIDDGVSQREVNDVQANDHVGNRSKLTQAQLLEKEQNDDEMENDSDSVISQRSANTNETLADQESNTSEKSIEIPVNPVITVARNPYEYTSSIARQFQKQNDDPVMQSNSHANEIALDSEVHNSPNQNEVNKKPPVSHLPSSHEQSSRIQPSAGNDSIPSSKAENAKSKMEITERANRADNMEVPVVIAPTPEVPEVISNIQPSAGNDLIPSSKAESPKPKMEITQRSNRAANMERQDVDNPSASTLQMESQFPVVILNQDDLSPKKQGAVSSIDLGLNEEGAHESNSQEQISAAQISSEPMNDKKINSDLILQAGVAQKSVPKIDQERPSTRSANIEVGSVVSGSLLSAPGNYSPEKGGNDNNLLSEQFPNSLRSDRDSDESIEDRARSREDFDINEKDRSVISLEPQSVQEEALPVVIGVNGSKVQERSSNDSNAFPLPPVFDANLVSPTYDGVSPFCHDEVIRPITGYSVALSNMRSDDESSNETSSSTGEMVSQRGASAQETSRFQNTSLSENFERDAELQSVSLRERSDVDLSEARSSQSTSEESSSNDESYSKNGTPEGEITRFQSASSSGSVARSGVLKPLALRAIVDVNLSEVRSNKSTSDEENVERGNLDEEIQRVQSTSSSGLASREQMFQSISLMPNNFGDEVRSNESLHSSSRNSDNKNDDMSVMPIVAVSSEEAIQEDEKPVIVPVVEFVSLQQSEMPSVLVERDHKVNAIASSFCSDSDSDESKANGSTPVDTSIQEAVPLSNSQERRLNPMVSFTNDFRSDSETDESSRATAVPTPTSNERLEAQNLEKNRRDEELEQIQMEMISLLDTLIDSACNLAIFEALKTELPVIMMQEENNKHQNEIKTDGCEQDQEHAQVAMPVRVVTQVEQVSQRYEESVVSVVPTLTVEDEWQEITSDLGNDLGHDLGSQNQDDNDNDHQEIALARDTDPKFDSPRVALLTNPIVERIDNAGSIDHEIELPTAQEFSSEQDNSNATSLSAASIQREIRPIVLSEGLISDASSEDDGEKSPDNSHDTGAINENHLVQRLSTQAPTLLNEFGEGFRTPESEGTTEGTISENEGDEPVRPIIPQLDLSNIREASNYLKDEVLSHSTRLTESSENQQNQDNESSRDDRESLIERDYEKEKNYYVGIFVGNIVSNTVNFHAQERENRDYLELVVAEHEELAQSYEREANELYAEFSASVNLKEHEELAQSYEREANELYAAFSESVSLKKHEELAQSYAREANELYAAFSESVSLKEHEELAQSYEREANELYAAFSESVSLKKHEELAQSYERKANELYVEFSESVSLKEHEELAQSYERKANELYAAFSGSVSLKEHEELAQSYEREANELCASFYGSINELNQRSLAQSEFMTSQFSNAPFESALSNEEEKKADQQSLEDQDEEEEATSSDDNNSQSDYDSATVYSSEYDTFALRGLFAQKRVHFKSNSASSNSNDRALGDQNHIVSEPVIALTEDMRSNASSVSSLDEEESTQDNSAEIFVANSEETPVAPLETQIRNDTSITPALSGLAMQSDMRSNSSSSSEQDEESIEDIDSSFLDLPLRSFDNADMNAKSNTDVVFQDDVEQIKTPEVLDEPSNFDTPLESLQNPNSARELNSARDMTRMQKERAMISARRHLLEETSILNANDQNLSTNDGSNGMISVLADLEISDRSKDQDNASKGDTLQDNAIHETDAELAKFPLQDQRDILQEVIAQSHDQEGNSYDNDHRSNITLSDHMDSDIEEDADDIATELSDEESDEYGERVESGNESDMGNVRDNDEPELIRYARNESNLSRSRSRSMGSGIFNYLHRSSTVASRNRYSIGDTVEDDYDEPSQVRQVSPFVFENLHRSSTAASRGHQIANESDEETSETPAKKQHVNPHIFNRLYRTATAASRGHRSTKPREKEDKNLMKSKKKKPQVSVPLSLAQLNELNITHPRDKVNNHIQAQERIHQDDARSQIFDESFIQGRSRSFGREHSRLSLGASGVISNPSALSISKSGSRDSKGVNSTSQPRFTASSQIHHNDSLIYQGSSKEKETVEKKKYASVPSFAAMQANASNLSQRFKQEKEQSAQLGGSNNSRSASLSGLLPPRAARITPNGAASSFDIRLIRANYTREELREIEEFGAASAMPFVSQVANSETQGQISSQEFLPLRVLNSSGSLRPAIAGSSRLGMQARTATGQANVNSAARAVPNPGASNRLGTQAVPNSAVSGVLGTQVKTATAQANANSASRVVPNSGASNRLSTQVKTATGQANVNNASRAVPNPGASNRLGTQVRTATVQANSTSVTSETGNTVLASGSRNNVSMLNLRGVSSTNTTPIPNRDAMRSRSVNHTEQRGAGISNTKSSNSKSSQRK